MYGNIFFSILEGIFLSILNSKLNFFSKDCFSGVYLYSSLTLNFFSPNFFKKLFLLFFKNGFDSLLMKSFIFLLSSVRLSDLNIFYFYFEMIIANHNLYFLILKPNLCCHFLQFFRQLKHEHNLELYSLIIFDSELQQ